MLETNAWILKQISQLGSKAQILIGIINYRSKLLKMGLFVLWLLWNGTQYMLAKPRSLY